jgi:hypothetical protein
MDADWPSDTDFSRYIIIDDSLADSIPAAELSFEEPEAAELFDEALFLVDFIPEAVRPFDQAFVLVDSTSEAAELFEKFCFSDPAPKAAELSSEEPFPQVPSTDMETQDPPAEDSRLTEEASHDPTRYLFGPDAARPSDLSVPGATATDTDKESRKIMV